MIWIIGEYAERIDNADELLESFLESFPEEPAQVQLQLLTATVKLFLKKPTEGPQQMIQVLVLYTHVFFLSDTKWIFIPYSFDFSLSSRIFSPLFGTFDVTRT
jgi:vesicle coat complex subunit